MTLIRKGGVDRLNFCDLYIVDGIKILCDLLRASYLASRR